MESTEMNDLTEEGFEELVTVLSGVLGTMDSYLKLRGTESTTLRRIRAQRHVIAEALECIKRGYAPGKMPSVDERLELGNKRLHEVGELLTLHDAARVLGSMSPWTLRKHVAQGHVRVTRLGRRLFIREDELERIRCEGLPSLASKPALAGSAMSSPGEVR